MTSANDRRALGEVRGMAVQTLDRSLSSAATTSSACGQTLTHPAAAAVAVSSHHPFYISKHRNSSSSSERRCSNPILANLGWVFSNSSTSAQGVVPFRAQELIQNGKQAVTRLGSVRKAAAKYEAGGIFADGDRSS